MHRAMKTDSSLQEKNVVPPLRKFNQTEQIQTHTHPRTHSGAVARAQNAWFEAIATLAVPSHTPQQEGLSFILEQTCGYVVS